MSGQGWRQFNAGEVLTAAQVQGYLQDQAVIVLPSESGRMNFNVSEGMVTYLQNVDQLQVAIGTATWQNVNLSQSENLIINGAFEVWQRGTSFSSPATGAYTADRFRQSFNGTGATRTISRQTFTPGTAPVAGYESAYFYRYAQTVAGTGGTSQIILQQPIESVRTLAGQSVTISFWAKGVAGYDVTPVFDQYFGTGGSPSATVTTTGTPLTMQTSWSRFTQTLTLPSIAGKTIGTSGTDSLIFSLSIEPNITATIDIWGVQVESGYVANPFRRNAQNLQGELAACQRYYQQFDLSGQFAATGSVALLATKWSATDMAVANLYPATTMRVAPTMTRSITTARYVANSATATVNFSTYTSTPSIISLGYTNNAVPVSSGWLDTMGVHYASAEL